MKNNMLFGDEGLGGYFSSNGPSHKEIIRSGGDKTFVGRQHVFLNLSTNPWDTMRVVNPNRENLKKIDFTSYKNEVEALLADPSYQFAIIELISDLIEKPWKIRLLDSNWTQTQEYALKNVKLYVEKALENLEIEISTSYTIDLSSVQLRETKTPQSLIGIIGMESIKTCPSYNTLVNLIIPTIEKMIEVDLAENIQQDYYRMENDIMMLDSLMKKYPNYKDLLEKTTTYKNKA